MKKPFKNRNTSPCLYYMAVYILFSIFTNFRYECYILCKHNIRKALKLILAMKKVLQPLFFFCLFFCVLALPGCVTTSASLGANAIKAPYAINLRNYKTYAWYQNEPPAEAEYLSGYRPSLNLHIRQAVEQELEKRGYTKVSSNPDMLVAYDVSVSVPAEQDRAENFEKGFGYSYAYMSGYRYDYGYADMPGYRKVDLFKQGTLIVDIINPKSNLLLWRGWAEGSINNFKAGYNQIGKQVSEVMQKL